jgi:hypothetical protein
MTPDADPQPSAASGTDAEIQLLLSTDDKGRVPFPEGNSREIAAFLHALSHLDERGHIEHRLQNRCLACYLTESGKLLKTQAIAMRSDAARDYPGNGVRADRLLTT